MSYWSKRSRPDMKLAADWKAMNKVRLVEREMPIIEQKEIIDRMTGEPKVILVEVGRKRGPMRTTMIPGKDLHALAMQGRSR